MNLLATFRKRGNVWEYRLREYNLSKSGFRTKKEAKAEAEKLEKELERGGRIDKESTVYDLWQHWYDLEILPSKKSQATKDKHKLIGNQVKKYLGDKVAYNLRYSEYQQILNQYGVRVNSDTLARFNSVIRNSVLLANKDLIAIRDFTIGVKINAQKKASKPEDKYIASISDYQKLLTYLKGKMKYPNSVIPYFFYVQLKTGFRVGEVMALTWNDIDYSKKSIKTYRRIDSAKHIFVSAKTRTSIREIPVSDDVLQILDELRDEQRKLNIEAISDGLIFFTERYGLPTNSALNKALRGYLSDLGITPVISATGIRHTYCSLMLAKGVDISVLAKYMGHKDTKRIIDTYGHVLKELEEKENERLRNILAEF